MRDDAYSDQASSHDVAGARQVVNHFKEWERMVKEKSSNAPAFRAAFERVFDAQGLGSTTQSLAKRRLLRQAGAPVALLEMAEHADLQRAISAHEHALGAPTALDRDAIEHILYPAAPSSGDFPSKGVIGGHLTSELIMFAETDPEIVVREVPSSTGSGIRRYGNGDGRWMETSPGPAADKPRARLTSTQRNGLGAMCQRPPSTTRQ